MNSERVREDLNLKVIGSLLKLNKKRNSSSATKSRINSKSNILGKTNRYCPRCQRAIYKKQLENENGTYYLYGHTDFKTGDCAYTTYDFADLIEKHQLTNDEPLTKEQQDNKRKFSDMIANLFK